MPKQIILLKAGGAVAMASEEVVSSVEEAERLIMIDLEYHRDRYPQPGDAVGFRIEVDGRPVGIATF